MAAGNTFRAGQITMTGAAQQLSGMTSGSTGRLKNLSATNLVYVAHHSGVSSTNGYPLAAGESVEIEVLNLSKLWVIGTNPDKLAWFTIGG